MWVRGRLDGLSHDDRADRLAELACVHVPPLKSSAGKPCSHAGLFGGCCPRGAGGGPLRRRTCETRHLRRAWREPLGTARVDAGEIRCQRHADNAACIAARTDDLCRSETHRPWSGCIFVLVDNAAEYSGAQSAVSGRSGYGRRVLPGEGRELSASLVGAMTGVLPGVRIEDVPGVELVPDQEVVEDLAPQGADAPFTVGVNPRGLRRASHSLDVVGREDRVEGVGVLGVPVSEQETR